MCAGFQRLLSYTLTSVVNNVNGQNIVASAPSTRAHRPFSGSVLQLRSQKTRDRLDHAEILDPTLLFVNPRGGTIHRCIDISRYFSRDTYRDIIFYNRDFFFFFSTMIFI